MNKKINILLIAIMLMTILAPSVLADRAELTPTLTRYEPLPAQPGQYVTIYVELENDGDADTTNAAIEILDSFPFSLVSEKDRVKDLGIIKEQDSVVTFFKLMVDSEAAAGINKVKIRYTPDKNTDMWMTRELSIEVKISDAKLSVNKIEFIPEAMYPGDEGILTLTMKNSASMVFRDIAVKLDLETTTLTDLPFVPLNSVSEKHISLLKPGDLAQIEFQLGSYPTATPGYYKIPVTISFYDDTGAAQEQTDIIGLVISASPELKIVAEHVEDDDVAENQIRFKCINKGVNDLKFLDVVLQDGENYEIISLSENYIGDLDSDDYRTADFEIKSKEKEFDVIVKATFRDENNQEYSEIMNVPVKIVKHSSGNGGISFGTIFFLLVIAGLIYYIYRQKKKKK